MLFLMKYKEPNLKYEQADWSALSHFAPHQDQNEKKFNQQNVIFVNSAINKINNNNNFSYMQLFFTFILSAVTHNFVE